MTLSKNRFGLTGLRVSELCLGTSNFARHASQDESFAILDAFRDAGGNFIQTTGLCPGASLGDGFLGMPEEILGRWLKRRLVARASVVLATRVALTRPVIGGQAAYVDSIRRCVRDSIRRIGCGFLDLLVVEWTDGLVPVAESVAALEAIVATGEARHLVLANFPAAPARESIAATRRERPSIVGLQVDCGPTSRPARDVGLAKLCADHDLAVIARPSFAGAWRHRGMSPSPVASVLATVRSVGQLRESAEAARYWLADAGLLPRREVAGMELPLL